MMLDRREFVLTTLVAVAVTMPAGVAAAPVAVEVWKAPSCGCCKDWVRHLESDGFRVKVHDIGNTAARSRLGVPMRLGSCHTAQVEGYAIEGHVPAHAIRRLLSEQPNAIGLAVPGMPIASPGMDAPRTAHAKTPTKFCWSARTAAPPPTKATHEKR